LNHPGQPIVRPKINTPGLDEEALKAPNERRTGSSNGARAIRHKPLVRGTAAKEWVIPQGEKEMRRGFILILAFVMMMTVIGCPNPASDDQPTPSGTTDDNTGFDPKAVVRLTKDIWVQGAFSEFSRQAWYQFTSEAGQTSYLQVNSGGYGNGTKTCTSVYAYVFGEDGGLFTWNQPNNWSALKPILTNTTQQIYVLLTTTSYSTGTTYAIKAITAGGTQADMSLFATAGPTWINLEWQAPTADIGFYRLYRADNTADATYQQIATLEKTTSYRNTNLISGTEYKFRICSYDPQSQSEGPLSVPVSSACVTEIQNIPTDVPYDGNISSEEKKWFAFDAAAEAIYEISWNDAGQGDGTKSGDIKVSAYTETATMLFSNQDSAFVTPKTISTATAEKVYILVVPYYTSSTGTFTLLVTKK
jgi:hypothetical protein